MFYRHTHTHTLSPDLLVLFRLPKYVARCVRLVRSRRKMKATTTTTTTNMIDVGTIREGLRAAGPCPGNVEERWEQIK